MTFVDGLGVGDVHDVALRDRRRLSEDGVLIVVATLAGSNGRGALTAAPELIARGFGDGAEPLLDELRAEAERVLERAARRRRDARSSCCRSTCTTRSAASSTTARAGGR